MILTPAQTQMQDQLQRKHEHLQHLIVQQQEELRLVSEQLLMTRYGIPIVNVCYPATTSAAAISGTNTIQQQQQHQQHQQHHHPQIQIHNNYGQHSGGQHHHLQMPQQTTTAAAVDGSSQGHHGPMQGQDIHYMDGAGAHHQHQQQELEQLVPQGGGGGVSNNISGDMISYAAIPTDLGPIVANHQVHPHAAAMAQPQQQQQHRLEMIPYQLTQQQAHVLFGSNMSPNQMNGNSGEG